ncbi:MAG: hypothetical protein AB7E80_09945 [Hyphomicrobiaceae bacterium]
MSTREPGGSPLHRATRSYVRKRDLPPLLPLFAEVTEATNVVAQARLVGRLQRSLRAERRLGLAGHWTYDLARHAALLRAYRAERATLARQTFGGCEVLAPPAGRVTWSGP